MSMFEVIAVILCISHLSQMDSEEYSLEQEDRIVVIGDITKGLKRMCKHFSFDESLQNNNTNHIKALLMVQKDVIQEVLSDREKLIVNYCICKEYRQNAVAKMLEVELSTVNRTLKNALRKMRQYITICDKALIHYEKECKKYEEI